MALVAVSPDPWTVTADAGFLMAQDPLVDVPGALFADQTAEGAAVLGCARSLPTILKHGSLRAAARELPHIDIETTDIGSDVRAAERMHQAYSFLANAYLWEPGAEPTRTLPPQIAVPYVALSRIVDRPPVLSYAGTQLCNWRRPDPRQPIHLGNLEAIQLFQDLPDEEWFWIIHIAIEAAGGPAVIAGLEAGDAAERGDNEGLESALETVAEGFAAITALAQRIEEGCGPDVFFRTLRPFLFSPPEGIVYEGVAEYGGKPKSFLGQTGAQSSLLPALCGAIGIRHGETELTSYLDAVRAYMPPAHRSFLARLKGTRVRSMAERGAPPLKEIYNLCVDRATAFRRFHLTLAARYIAAHVPDPKGTGGTDFMRWLKHMTRETEDQRIS